MSVAVIGGGISGCVAVLSLHQQGIETVWIKPNDRLRQRLQWPESISWQGLERLTDFMDLETFLQNHGFPEHVHHSCWGSNQLLSRSKQRMRRQSNDTQLVNKAALVEILSRQAERTRCELIRGRVEQIERQDETWQLHINQHVSKSVNGIVLAHGKGPSNRLLGPAKATITDVLQCHHWILRTTNTNLENSTTGSLVEACPEGWWYAATLGPNAISITSFQHPTTITADHGSQEYLRERLNSTIHLKRWIQESQWRHFQRPHIFRLHCQCRDQFSGGGTDATSPFWFSVGDAAATLDPLSSFGSAHGIWSASEAARSIGAMLNDPNHTASKSYDNAMHRLHHTTLLQRQQMYNLEQRFKQHPFWRHRTPSPKRADR